MKLKRRIITVVFFIFYHKIFALTRTYELEIHDGEKTNHQYMIVTNKAEAVEVEVIDSKNEKQIVSYKNSTQIQDARYINSNGQKFLEVTYDYDKQKINITGTVNNSYRLKENTYDNNGSLFYLFGKIYPEKNETMIFTLLQSKLDRTVEMYLKQAGEEELWIGGKKIKALKYEMGINGFILSAFWPYKYYYWYSATDRRFLKYEGPDENKKVQTIQLVKYVEK